MARTLEFYYDYGSPYSYLADTQVEAIARRAGAALVRKPMLLGGVFKATGNASPMTVETEVEMEPPSTCRCGPGITACRSSAIRSFRSIRSP